EFRGTIQSVVRQFWGRAAFQALGVHTLSALDFLAAIFCFSTNAGASRARLPWSYRTAACVQKQAPASNVSRNVTMNCWLGLRRTGLKTGDPQEDEWQA